MKQGVYKIAGLVHGNGSDVVRKHYGRLAVINGHTQVLEDTRDGFLSRAFPDGVVDDRKQRRWSQMASSPYFHISTEGLVDEDPVDMPQPVVSPDEVFDVEDNYGTRQVLEAFGENLFLDGKRLSEQGVADLQRRVHLGELHLLPRHQ
jgi:hypothetical protein